MTTPTVKFPTNVLEFSVQFHRYVAIAVLMSGGTSSNLHRKFQNVGNYIPAICEPSVKIRSRTFTGPSKLYLISGTLDIK